MKNVWFYALLSCQDAKIFPVLDWRVRTGRVHSDGAAREDRDARTEGRSARNPAGNRQARRAS